MRKHISAWIASGVAALSALGALRLLSPWLGFALQINTVTLAVAGLLGLPGVILLLLLRLLLVM